MIQHWELLRGRKFDSVVYRAVMLYVNCGAHGRFLLRAIEGNAELCVVCRDWRPSMCVSLFTLKPCTEQMNWTELDIKLFQFCRLVQGFN